MNYFSLEKGCYSCVCVGIMVKMESTQAFGIRIDDDYCGECLICPAVCPFEAISVDEDSGKIKLDVERCQMCGLCVTACPVSAIDLVYYDIAALVDQVKTQMDETGYTTLVLTCRGSNPTIDESEQPLKDQKIERFVSLRLPCVGRVPPQFFLESLALGIERIVVIQCEEDFCRFKDGSRIGTNRFLLIRTVLDQLGYEPDTLRLMNNAVKAVYETEKCVGCGKCVFICPYDAIEWNHLGTPEVDPNACVGCGACALVCPHQAIELEGYQYEPVSQLIRRFGERARRAKSRGVTPVVLVLCCQWSEFSALDDAQRGLLRENVMIIELPCAKGLDPIHVLAALQSGFDGVLAIVCPENECKLEKGVTIPEQNVAALKKVLKQLGLEDRFEIATASPRLIGDFDAKLRAFNQRVSSLGKSTIQIAK